MRRMDRDRFGGFRLEPAPQRPPARKHQRVRTISVDHGKLDFGVERRSTDGQPHAGLCKPAAKPRLDLAQMQIIERSLGDYLRYRERVHRRTIPRSPGAIIHGQVRRPT